MILKKKGICMANKTVKIKVLIFIMGIGIKIVKLCVLENSPVNIVPMHIKRSMIINFFKSEIVSNHELSSALVESITQGSQSVSEARITYGEICPTPMKSRDT